MPRTCTVCLLPAQPFLKDACRHHFQVDLFVEGTVSFISVQLRVMAHFLDRLCIDAAKSELEPKNTSAGFFYLVTFLQPVFILMVCSMLPGNSAGYDVWNSYHTIAALCYLPHWLGYAYSECSGSDKWFVLILVLIGT